MLEDFLPAPAQMQIWNEKSPSIFPRQNESCAESRTKRQHGLRRTCTSSNWWPEGQWEACCLEQHKQSSINTHKFQGEYKEQRHDLREYALLYHRKPREKQWKQQTQFQSESLFSWRTDVVKNQITHSTTVGATAAACSTLENGGQSDKKTRAGLERWLGG